MQILLAAAKTIRQKGSPFCEPVPTKPLFQEKAASIAHEMAGMSAVEISQMMDCSAAIAEKARASFEEFDSHEALLYPAVFAYFGQAYKHLKAETLTQEDLCYAMDRLWITSFMYGLLRPLDAIQPYRMEASVRLNATDKEKITDFWKPYLTDILIDSVKQDDGILVHLSTEEFQHMFFWDRVCKEIQVIQPKFYVQDRNGRLSMPAVWAKTCRGAMTRYLIQQRIADPKDIEAFQYEGFRFDKGKGIFVRSK